MAGSCRRPRYRPKRLSSSGACPAILVQCARLLHERTPRPNAVGEDEGLPNKEVWWFGDLEA